MKKKGHHTNKVWSQWFRQSRLAKGLSGRELARRAGIEPSYITYIERYHFVPRPPILEKLAEVLGGPLFGCLLAGWMPECYRSTVEQVEALETAVLEVREAQCTLSHR